ncbi:hypothetical protein Cgig2_006085 [Carnegiea gigantea]|uniref:Plastid division protein CDP1-like IMS domain-containing protein n=1 Tax=Carnegiea gigantea TaxID=171969 RepID=A0A9Q1QU14_9CARY|nr:hypothetical protein Cgig2_006085 [Carnegiea gigantea]
MKELISTVKRSEFSVGNQHKSCVTASLSSPAVVYDRVMPFEEAEALVRQRQMIKAKALEPAHQMHLVFDITDGFMLLQWWQALTEEATAKLCFWRFVLLQFTWGKSHKRFCIKHSSQYVQINYESKYYLFGDRRVNYEADIVQTFIFFSIWLLFLPKKLHLETP